MDARAVRDMCTDRASYSAPDLPFDLASSFKDNIAKTAFLDRPHFPSGGYQEPSLIITPSNLLPFITSAGHRNLVNTAYRYGSKKRETARTVDCADESQIMRSSQTTASREI